MDDGARGEPRERRICQSCNTHEIEIVALGGDNLLLNYWNIMSAITNF